jgi:S1-C subfamily serine protease
VAASTSSVASIVPTHVLDPQNPWPGLDAFDESASPFFNGREQEQTELARLIAQAPLTVLFGKSGLGKTSLLKAGLFPLLRAQGILPIYVRLAVLQRDQSLIDQLMAALAREAAEHAVQVAPGGFTGTLWELLHQRDFALWSATNQPLIPLFVLDQFEEIFTLGAANRTGVERLRVDIADLVENRIPAPVVVRLESSVDTAASFDVRRQRYKVLISFREDFLPDIETWRSTLPSLMHNRFRLSAMNAAQGFAAVYKTGAAAQLVDEPTAREIVRFVGKIQSDDRSAATATRSQQVAGEPDVDDFTRHEIEPALLSLVCAELNKRRQAARRSVIDAELLRGTAASIIADFYLRQVGNVPATTRRFIEDELLTEGGYRSSFPVDEALKQGALTEAELRRLIDGRLLRIEHQLGVPRVELTHDRLTDVVELERDKRRTRERSEGRRRAWRWYGTAAAGVLILALFGAFNWVARTAAENERIAAQRERDEANIQRHIAEGASREAQAERDEANRQRTEAEAARKAALEERQRAEEQRLLAEERQQKILDEQARARAADTRAEAAADDAKRQNALVGELYAPARPGVLRIESEGSVTATGFFITRTGLAVTAGHVIQNNQKQTLTARNFDGRQFNVRVVRLEATRDLALLQISDSPNSPCLQFTSAPPAIDTPVAALSIAPPRGWIATSGKILRLSVSLGPKLGGIDNRSFMDGDLIETDLEAEAGFSGAPVMDPYARRVVGIGAYGNTRPVPRHYLIPASRIRATFASELAGNACPDI